jgi:Ca2+/Na+ antiporter
MQYLIFAFGIIIGIFALYRYFINARPEDIKRFITHAFIGLFVLILLYFAMSGRILVSLALLVVSMPFIVIHYRKKKKSTSPKDQDNTNDID